MNKNPAQIVLFQEDEKALNYRYKQNYHIGSEIQVKSLEYDYDDFAKNNKLIGNRVNENTLYFLHPYKNNVYLNESLGEEYFLEEKLQLYKRAASLLGAKSISTKVIFKESRTINTDVNGEVKYKVVSIEGGSKRQIVNSYKNSLEITEEFELQNNFDKAKNIKELNEFIDKHNLHHEIGLISLIEARDSSNSGTLITSRKVKSEITSEYNNLLEVSAKLNSPVFNISGGYKRKLEEVNTLMVEIDFIF
ncbi:hypothetical protein [Algibacter sp. 2305UL17-15]|uniref:hypothetical protein n=1 Tax=Algibacter sp. 2305UL17-15 TaxID=3231268 RepID=UPI003459B7A8